MTAHASAMRKLDGLDGSIPSELVDVLRYLLSYAKIIPELAELLRPQAASVAMAGANQGSAAMTGPDRGAQSEPTVRQGDSVRVDFTPELRRLHEILNEKSREIATLQETIKSLESANRGLNEHALQQSRQLTAVSAILRKAPREFCEEQERI